MTHLATILRLLALAAAGYALLCALVYLMQERLIFFPERDPPGTRYAFGAPAQEQFIPVEGSQLHALLFRAPEPRGVILYLHGNAGSLRSWGAVAPDFVARGYDVLLVDYRGYGQSGGRIAGEAQLHADMAAVYAWVAARYPEEQIVLYGRSLGSALAARLAAERAPRLLILESPFYSLEAIARRQFPFVPPFLLKYPLRTWRWMGQVRCPVVLIHGTADEVVPFADGERLAASVTTPLRFHRVAGGGHNDLARLPAYWAAIDEALGAERR
ncbi:MAG TPA: alpha/beta fold hydrolase [Chloroflexaceae bacterium]|mgnify:CR=1 FL=1|nr:alpha/beta fold hydrolase [Chloroflexaceae bacterium]